MMPVTIRPYQLSDRKAVRTIFGMDEFARPKLLQKYPRFSEYLADEMSYYPDYEAGSLFLAETNGQVVGTLLGAIETEKFERVYPQRIHPKLVQRGLVGGYEWSGWLPAILYTEWAERKVSAPKVDHIQYPAHLHIGVLPEWLRMGIGTALMQRYAEYVKERDVPGYHLYASSFHPPGVSFYLKLGLDLLGQFEWRLHTGFEWVNVIERIFGKRV